MTSINRSDLVVVGGGISGLGFAHMAARDGGRPVVLEADSRAGGALCSHLFATPEGPFWVEMGAHTCYNSYGNLLQILEDLGLIDGLLPKEKLSYRFFTGEAIKSIPSQLGFLELLGSLPRLFLLKKQGKTVSEYFSTIVGRRNFQRVIGPALNAVICQESGDFPAEALFRKKPRRKEVVRNFTSSGGVGAFAKAIASQPHLEVREGTRVSAIEQTDGGYRLQTSGNGVIETSRLVLAVAPDVAASLLTSVNSKIAQLLQTVEMVDIETMAIILPADACSIEPLAGIIAGEDRFYSAVSRDPVPDSRYRAFTFHFRPEGLDRAAKLERICQVLNVDSAAIHDVAERRNRLPALRLGHDRLVRQIDNLIAGEAVAITGNWFSGVSVEDCLIRSAQEYRRLSPE